MKARLKTTLKTLQKMKIARFFLIISLIAVLDQATKFFIRINNINSVVIKNILSFTFLINTGVSFGLLKGHNWVFTIISFIAIVLFSYLFTQEKKYTLQFSFILGGVAGNMIDRIYLGYVVDFINFHIWPVFNIADSCVFIGTLWLVYLLWKEDKK